MLKNFLTRFQAMLDSVAPSPERIAQREAAALQTACCALLSEVARLDDARAEPKRQAVAQAMREQFALGDALLQPMLDDAFRTENRLTSYFKPATLLNQGFSPARRAQLVEQRWRIAMIDGDIDRYEDHLVRKISDLRYSDLLYVAHADFILAKNRVQAAAATT
jgi:uncharacterized tellurite resistance protein B-like protein